MPTIIPLVILNVIKNFATPPYPPFWRRLEDTLRSKCAESTINPSVSPFSERERFPLSLLSFLHQLNPPSALSLNPSLEDGTKRMTRVGGYRNPGEATINPSMSRPQQAEDFPDILLLMYDDKFIRFVKTPEIFINKYHDLRLIMGHIYHNVKNKSIF